MLADGGLALTLEHGIDQGELPGGRSLFGQNAVTSTIEVEILGLIADLVQRGETGAGMEVHVAEKSVLRGVEADRDRGGVAVADLEIDVAHGRIEGTGIGVGDLAIRRHAAGWGKRHAEARCQSTARTRAGEHDHHADTFLKTRRVGREHEHGPA